MSTAEERLIALEGAYNFRDLGGYSTTDGRTVAWGRLYRADQLGRLTPADLTRLEHDLGVRAVIDLRTSDELERHGPAAIRGARFHHMPLFDVLPPVSEGQSWREPDFLVERYVEITAEGRERLGAAVRVLAAPGTLPAVFHCAVGKDRTGILAAVVLAWLGVPDEVVAADYAISSHSLLPMVAAAEARGDIDADALEGWRATVTASTPEVMHGFLGRLRERHGDLGAFAAWLGVADTLPALRAALLAPG